MSYSVREPKTPQRLSSIHLLAQSLVTQLGIMKQVSSCVHQSFFFSTKSLSLQRSLTSKSPINGGEPNQGSFFFFFKHFCLSITSPKIGKTSTRAWTAWYKMGHHRDGNGWRKESGLTKWHWGVFFFFQPPKFPFSAFFKTVWSRLQTPGLVVKAGKQKTWVPPYLWKPAGWL